MGEKTLFLAWQDRDASREWFPVGRLDAGVENKRYRFRYIGGAMRAKETAGFPLIISFPRINGDYKSTKLFPTFSNRVMRPGRPDFKDYLKLLALTEDSDPIDMMAVSGGRRVTDSYEVFPQIVKQPDGGFACRFFLHGGRHVSKPAQERLDTPEEGETLYLALEPTNPLGEPAVQIQTTDCQMMAGRRAIWSPTWPWRSRPVPAGRGSCG